MSVSSQKKYKYLEARPGSSYKQLWLKGRRIRTGVVWEDVHGPDHYRPEEVAENFHLPLEAVLEALDYVENNMPIIQQDWDEELALMRAHGIPWPPPASDESSSAP
jgi:uncharacterized protein (DUF433 family)